MSKRFNGIISLDIRDSIPDWDPYEQPKAPEGAPNVLFIVWDDTGSAPWRRSAVRSRCRRCSGSSTTGFATPSSTRRRSARRRERRC